MKNIFKKIINLACLTFILIGLTAPIYYIFAENYIPLAPLPGITTFNPENTGSLGLYLNTAIPLFIGICAVLAVIMIVIGGMQYMTNELVSGKEAGKERIRNAIFGLLLALGAWAILNTINPKLMDVGLGSLKEQIVDLGGEGSRVLEQETVNALPTTAGIICPKRGGILGPPGIEAIARSYIGHSAYSMDDRNKVINGVAYVDCSSFADQVYRCAGLPSPGGTSAGIFGSGSSTAVISADGKNVNGVPLKAGELIGWVEDKSHGGKEKNGHVMIYIGGGKMIDAQGGAGVGVRSVSQYASRIKFKKP